MRRILFAILILSVSRLSGAGEPAPPPWPKADYPVIEDLVPAGPAPAASAWKPSSGDCPASAVEVGGRKALRLECKFKNTDFERAYWDRAIELDLSIHQGIQFRFYCEDFSPVSHFTLYFQSGDGWYNIPFHPEREGAWDTITIRKADSRIEGRPAGWGKIDRIRISAWRGQGVDTSLYVADFGRIGEGARIAIVHAESESVERPGRESEAGPYVGRAAQWLDDLGLSYVVMSDLDVTAVRLRGMKLVILPHNPRVPKSAETALLGFVRKEGRLLSFYHLPGRLAAACGFEPGRYIRPKQSGRFASIVFRKDAESGEPELRGAPEVVAQRSHNIVHAGAVPGMSRVAAIWHDANGAPTGEPAVVVSTHAVHMTHVLLADDPENKRRMFLAMIGALLPEAWDLAAKRSIATIGEFGPFESFERAGREIRKRGDGRDDVLSILRHAERKRGEASGLARSGDHPAAIEKSADAREALLEAWCSVQKPKPGEFRAFWCHSAFGVAGMTWDEAVRNLAENGFTAVLPNMLWGGVAYYQSDVLPVAREVAERGDQIAECLAACKKYGVQCHVWKVNWNMSGRAPRDFADRMAKAGRTQVGFDRSHQDRWLCPSHPANRELEIESMLELVRKYDVDGIHFDYIRYPDEQHCFCDGCRERFEARIGKAVTSWPRQVRSDRELRRMWLDFRRDNITTVVATVCERTRKIRPDVKISAAVFANWTTARDGVGQDWKQWCEKGYLDFVCPMDYTSSNAGFENLVEKQLAWAGRTPCRPGIGLSVWTPRGDICGVIDKVEIVRRLGAPGFTVFNYGDVEARRVVPLLGRGITRKN